MQLVYVCSPYKGKDKNYIANYQRAKQYCKQLISEGYIPLAPHVFYTQLLDIDDSNDMERERGLKLGIEVLSKCEKMIIFGMEISEGMKREIDFAKYHNIPIERRHSIIK
jgi:hypothetical protein